MKKTLLTLMMGLVPGLVLAPSIPAHASGDKHKKIQLTPGAQGPQGHQQAWTMVMDMRKGRLGAKVMSMSDDLRDFFGAPKGVGILVDEVEVDSPAAKAGLKAGDVILEVDGDSTTSPVSVGAALADRGKGELVKVLVLRKNKTVALDVTLNSDAMPALGQGFGPNSGPGQFGFGFDFDPFGGFFDFDQEPKGSFDPNDKKQLKKGLERMEKFLDRPQNKRARELEQRIERLEKQLEKLDKKPTT